MFVTLYTDASHDENTNRFTYAFSAKSDDGRISRRGACSQDTTDINTAEFYAIVAGVYRIRQEWPHADRVLICSDSASAILYVMGKRSLQRLPDAVREHWTKSCQGIRLICKKVKSHSGGTGKPAKMNRLVDKQARRARKNL